LPGKRVGRFEYANEEGVELALADAEPLHESGGLNRRFGVGWKLENSRTEISKPLLFRNPGHYSGKRP